MEKQQQQQLRYPSQSPIRRSKWQRLHPSPSGLVVSVVKTIVFRYFLLWLTLPILLFFFASWSQVRMLDDDQNNNDQQTISHPKKSFRDGQLQVVKTVLTRRKSHRSSKATERTGLGLRSKLSIGSQHLTRKKPKEDLKNLTSSTPSSRLSSGLDAAVIQQRMSYNASVFPLLDFAPSIQFPTPVHFVVGASPASLDSPTSTLPTKWFLDGLERSQYMQVMAVSYYYNPRHVWTAQRVVRKSKSSSTPLVWVVDWASLQQDCHALVRVLQTEAVTHKVPKSQQHLLFLDSSGSVRQDISCSPMLEKYFDKDMIRLAKRSIVHNRYWMDQDQWVNVGQILPQPLTTYQRRSGGVGGKRPVLHMPLVVRDDIVELFYNATTSTRSRHLNWKQQRRVVAYPASAKRFADVTFFWRKGDYSHYGKLRRKVSEVVQSLNNVVVIGKSGRKQQRIRTLVRIFGDEDGIEQGTAQFEYVQQLLSTKIVVVAQRDEWEDQYMLLEAMACGAMVMTDVMLSLPSGLVDGKHVVVYESAKSLRKLILYYLNPKQEQERLAIAKQGWQVAMQRHRSWHRMEELIFGKPLTDVDSPFAVTPNFKTKRTFSS